MHEQELIDWLLAGDVSIQYQTHRDLLGEERPDLRIRIEAEGWGARFLAHRRADGHWGRGYYTPKWTSTHYTLVDLKNLAISTTVKEIQESLSMVIDNHKAKDGGILPVGPSSSTDLCIDAMFLNVASYFKIDEVGLHSLIDRILDLQMPDGGYNCRITRGGAVHSSMHTTISVLEGITEYLAAGYTYRHREIKRVQLEAQEFLLMHRLFRSDKSGEIIDKRFTMLSYPSRWRYDILRALDAFQHAGVGFDPRMDDALEIIRKKRRKDGAWPVQARHPGEVHFQMEKTGGPSRWNTLRVLRVFRHFGIEL
jgi:hypothetical protein